MPKNLKRYYGRGDLHFLTFSCYRRLPLLRAVDARNVFVQALNEIRARYGFPVVGYVVMPEHVHLLIGESPGAMPSLVLEVLKQRVSRDLRRPKIPTRKTDVWGTLGRHSSSPLGHAERRLARFWQTRFYDFNAWNAQKIPVVLEYMHLNPVKRKLVAHPKDWPWSSWSFYEMGQTGLIPIDPVGS